MKNVLRRTTAALRSREWWTTIRPFRTVALVLFATIVPVAVLAVPSKVSVDGIYYVLGAKTLFTPEFATLYPLFREPGYPAFLAFIHLFSGASVAVVAAQAALLAFAGFAGLYAMYRALGKSGVPRFVTAIALVLLLNPIYLTYAGHFMQQAFFAALLACFVVLVEWSRKPPTRLARWRIFVLVVVTNVVGVWSSIGWLYLGLFPTVLALSFLVLPLVTRRQMSGLVKGVVGVLVIGMLSGATVMADRAVYAGWERLRDSQTTTNANTQLVLAPLTGVPAVPAPLDIVRLYGTLIGIGQIPDYPKENDQFLAEQMRIRFYHSEWDTAYVREPYTSAALGYIALDDPSIVAHTIYALGSQPIGGFLFPGVAYSVVMLLGHITVLVAAIRRRWALVALLLIPVSWLGVYALSATPIDRYGIPAYPLLLAATALACDRSWWRRRADTTPVSPTSHPSQSTVEGAR